MTESLHQDDDLAERLLHLQLIIRKGVSASRAVTSISSRCPVESVLC